MNNDDMSEDEFDAFLNGKDDLSRRLRALPQQGPSADLDAAILNRVQLALAQEQRPAAANDPAEEAPTPRLQPNFATRWRLPVGIAATVLAGVFAHQAFQVTQEARLAEVMPAPVLEESKPVPELPAPAEVMADAAPAAVANAPLPEKKAAAPRVRELAKPAADKVGDLARTQVAKPATAEVEAPLAAPPPPPPEAYARMSAATPAAPAAPAPAPVVSAKPGEAGLASGVPMPAPAPAMDRRDSRSEEVLANATSSAPRKAAGVREQVVVTGSRIANAAPSGTPAVQWLALIESLLKADLKRDALGEWRRFRAEYPAYPVPDELQAKIKAIEP